MSFSSPNYTQAPNDLFDEHLKDMGEAELKVMLVLIRYTFGYHRDQVQMSQANIARLSGLAESSVVVGATQAENRGLIERTTDKDNPREPTVWKIKIDITPTVGVIKADYPDSRGIITPKFEVPLKKERKAIKQTRENSEQKIQRAPSDINAMTKQSIDTFYKEHASLTDIGPFPPDISDIIQKICDLWHLKPPRRKGEIANWIECGRDLLDACGEHGVAAIEQYRKAFEDYMATHNGVAPFVVCGPSSLVKAVRGEAARMREGNKFAKPVVAVPPECPQVGKWQNPANGDWFFNGAYLSPGYMSPNRR